MLGEGVRFVRHAVIILMALVCVAGLIVGCSRSKHEAAERVTPVSTAHTAKPGGSLTASPRDDVRTSTPTPTPPYTPDQAVLDAYQHYWDAYSAALLELDPNLVQMVASGEEQERIRQEIEMFRSKGVALRVRVERHPLIIEVKDTTAVIYDEVTNQSFYVDANTKQPPQGTGSGELLRDTYYLSKLDGMWKVVRSTRQR